MSAVRQAIDSSSSVARAQRGAALVIGLILLLVLTILAVSGMSAASLEFIMAGNEQYRQYAFQAAETGIQEGMAKGTFNPASGTEPAITGTVGSSGQAYSSVVNPQLGGLPTVAPTGSSLTTFSAYHWEITSTGSSTRSARAIHVQGVYRKALASDTLGSETTSNTKLE